MLYSNWHKLIVKLIHCDFRIIWLHIDYFFNQEKKQLLWRFLNSDEDGTRPFIRKQDKSGYDPVLYLRQVQMLSTRVLDNLPLTCLYCCTFTGENLQQL